MYPRDITVLHTKVLRDLRDAQRHGEEIESIPCPAHETDRKHQPLVAIELAKDLKWITEVILSFLGFYRRENTGERGTLGGLSELGRVRK